RLDSGRSLLAEIADERPAAPVEVDAAEQRLLGGFDGRRLRLLVDHVVARIGVDVAGAGVDLRGLEEILRLENRVPAKGIDGIRLERDSKHRYGCDLRVLEERDSLGMLRPAPAPQDHHAGEGEDRPSASAKLDAPSA